MPSNRSILADITEFGLNPHENHRQISACGRLKNQVHEQVVPVENKKQVEVKVSEVKPEQDKTEVKVASQVDELKETIEAPKVSTPVVETPEASKEVKKQVAKPQAKK